MVVPEHVNDADMVLLARDIAKQIEAELEYPGQIKVNVIRESRAVDYAKLAFNGRKFWKYQRPDSFLAGRPFFVMWKNGHITGKTGVNWYRVSKWRVRQRTGSGKMPDVFRRSFFL